MDAQNDGARGAGEAGRRAGGVALVTASAAMVAFMAMHPTVHAHDAAGFSAEITKISAFNGVVHATLIGVMAVLGAGVAGLATRLGTGLWTVRAGLVAGAIGGVWLTLAALINGFVLAEFMANFAADPVGTAGQWRPIVLLCHDANGVLSRAGVVTLSAALTCWAAVLLRRGKGAAWLGGLALFCGIAPPALLAAGRLPMSVHGFGAFVLAQGVWYACAGAAMIRGRL